MMCDLLRLRLYAYVFATREQFAPNVYNVRGRNAVVTACELSDSSQQTSASAHHEQKVSIPHNFKLIANGQL